MDNIFENAYFGKAYKTRDGRKAIYVGGCRCVIENNTNSLFRFRSNGMSEGWATDVDIVSEWQEEIDDKTLNTLADESFYDSGWGDSDNSLDAYIDGFKKGYRKAKEEYL